MQHSVLCLSDARKGAKEISEFVAAGKATGLKALALIGRGTLFGVRRFVLECHQQDILPVIGCEFLVAGPNGQATCLALVQSEVGFRRLRRLSTLVACRPAEEWFLTETVLGEADNDLAIFRGDNHASLSPERVEELAHCSPWDQSLPKLSLPHFLPPAEFVGTTEEYFRHLVQEGLAERYPVVTLEIQQRADHELNQLIAGGCADYFLIWADMLAWARSRGIPVGPGRGTAPSSLVAYALNITSFDPLAYDLVFERFYNLKVSLLPDIDVDVGAARRGEVVDYLKERWGHDKVAEVAFHPCGLILSARPLAEAFALFRDPGHGTLVPQCAFYELELYGLVKFDLLALKALDGLPQADVPLDDLATWQAFARGQTEGVFSFESPGTQERLRQVRPSNLEELSAVNALYRPGNEQEFEAYCAAPQSPAKTPEPNDPVATLLSGTRGVLVYQEQVIQILAHLMATGTAEADTMRRVLFGQDPAKVEAARAQFLEAASRNGYSTAEALPVWERLSHAARRPFIKSHSVAYSLLAYRVAFKQQYA